MSKSNDDTTKTRELTEAELAAVSGGVNLQECLISGVVAHVTDGTSNTIAFGW